MKKILIILLFAGLAITSNAQLSGYNLLETQFGNVPGQEPDNLRNLYDQFNIQYQTKGIRAFVRLEQFYSNRPDGDEYTRFTQYSLNYRRKGFEAKLGNFYETLGRGLLLRGYEIKNSIYEDRIYQVRQGFYKDVQGAFVRYSNKWFEVKALRGKNLVPQLPPDHPDNREDLVTAGELTLFLFNQNIGAIYLNNDNPSDHSNYLSFHLGGSIADGLDYFGELAHRTNGESSYLSFDDQASYGAYFNLNYSTSNFGASLEWKDYHNFVIGTGLSDPPTLVREHNYRTLNRSTHVSELIDERGIQLELFYTIDENNRLTFNHSRGENELVNTFKFKEYFLEWYADFTSMQLKTFVDYAEEEFKLEDSRIATGVYLTKPLKNRWVVSLETEAQQIKRSFGENSRVENLYAGLIFSKSSKFSAALVWEFTNDELVADLPSTEEIEKRQHYLSTNLSYRPNYKNTLQLFAGKRRGGPACTSGICYEVLDFEGVELRWTKRF